MLLVIFLIDIVHGHRLDSRLDRSVVARFERHRHGGSDRIEVDIGGARQERRFVGQACRTVPILKKPSTPLFPRCLPAVRHADRAVASTN
jgi:hypothetical protein